MIDPSIWADTPGMGRAPLVPGPSQAASDPMADIARRLIQAQGGEGRTLPGDMPVGALVRDPATMTQGQQIAEMMALGGFPHEGTSMAARGPAMAAGALGTLGAGVPGLGYGLGQMAKAGIQGRQQDLAGALTQGMANAMERGSQARDQRDITQPSTAFADAYEAGRQAAVGHRNEGGGQSRDQRDIDRSSRGSRDTQHSIAI